MEDEKTREERMILSHQPVPGYRAVFHIILAIAFLYLVVVFLQPSW